MQRMNSVTMNAEMSICNRAPMNRLMISRDARRTLRTASAMPALESFARLERILSSARIRLRSVSDAPWRSCERRRDRSMTRPKRLVMLKRMSPTPEMRMTGPIDSCNVVMRSVSNIELQVFNFLNYGCLVYAMMTPATVADTASSFPGHDVFAPLLPVAFSLTVAFAPSFAASVAGAVAYLSSLFVSLPLWLLFCMTQV